MPIRPSIRTYLISLNMLLLGVLFPLFSALFLRDMVHLRDVQLERNIQAIRQNLTTRSRSLIRSTALSAKEAIAGFDFTFLQNLLDEVIHDDPEIQACLVINLEQTIIAHNDRSLVGSPLPASEQGKMAALMAALPPTQPEVPAEVQFLWPTAEDETGPSKILQTLTPLYSGNALWGLIRCDYSLATIDAQLAQARAEWSGQLRQMKIYFLFLLIGFLCVGLAIAVLLTGSFVRATQALHAGVQQVASGELDHEIRLPGGIICQEFVGLVNSFNTMTERLRLSHQQLDDYSKSLEAKVDERTGALHEAQALMIQQAHEAGLAEMAVGVLHNIGNAITPAQVGVMSLGQALATNPLRTRLTPSLHPLRQYLADGRELTSAAKSHLATIIDHLPSAINEVFDATIKELEEISDKHHHIETIIKLQMRYAHLLDTPRQIDLNHLAQDAINLLADTIDKRQITLTVKLGEPPPVKADESKLLQVMINLIKNGYEAMDGCERRELTIETGVDQGAALPVFFAVSDTGCGFSAADKDRLFAFGYSSKERGSGFGLHSSANYLIANHGTLEAESAGHNLGAKFTVHLPTEQGTKA